MKKKLRTGDFSVTVFSTCGFSALCTASSLGLIRDGIVDLIGRSSRGRALLALRVATEALFLLLSGRGCAMPGLVRVFWHWVVSMGTDCDPLIANSFLVCFG